MVYFWGWGGARVGVRAGLDLWSRLWLRMVWGRVKFDKGTKYQTSFPNVIIADMTLIKRTELII